MGQERVPIGIGGKIRPKFLAKLQYTFHSGEANEE